MRKREREKKEKRRGKREEEKREKREEKGNSSLRCALGLSSSFSLRSQESGRYGDMGAHALTRVCLYVRNDDKGEKRPRNVIVMADVFSLSHSYM